MSEGSQLLVAEEGPVALMQIIGRGTYQLADGFRKWNEQLLASQDIKTVMIDFSHCASVDSTFMGLMVTLALKSRGRMALLVVNASEEHHKLLDGIGVMRIWKYVDQPVGELNWKSLMTAANGSVNLDAKLRQLIIDAHSKLMDFDEANVPKFKDVVELMKHETM